MTEEEIKTLQDDYHKVTLDLEEATASLKTRETELATSQAVISELRDTNAKLFKKTSGGAPEKQTEDNPGDWKADFLKLFKGDTK